MDILRTEHKVVAFEVNGDDWKGEPIVQTIYDYDLRVDPIVNKPCFYINSSSLILLPSNASISFGCFVVFLFDENEKIPTVEELLIFAEEGRDLINDVLASKVEDGIGLSNIEILPINKHEAKAIFTKLVLIGYRLN